VTAAAWRALGLPVDRRLLVISAALAVLALGLPWQRVPLTPGISFPGDEILLPVLNDDGIGFTPQVVIPPVNIPSFGGYTIPGTGHAMRLTLLAAAVLLGFAVRRGSRTIAWLALAVGAVALPLGVGHGALMPGRVAYLAALLTAAIALGLLRRPRLQVRRARLPVR
jgi:hypothetical protein